MLNNKICNFNNNTNQLQVINNDVYVDNKILIFLGSGVDGIVYRYKNKAIKLYHDNYPIKMHLTKEEIKRLSTIKTKHIILPKEILINNQEYYGFIMDYIDLNTKKDFIFAPISHLINEIRKLEKELIIIGKNHFLLEDIEPRNLFYNNSFYLFDADSFTYEKEVDFSSKNIEMFTWCFMRAISLSLASKLTTKEQTALVRKMHYLYTKGNYRTLSAFLEQMCQEENLKTVNIKIMKKKFSKS